MDSDSKERIISLEYNKAVASFLGISTSERAR